MHSARSAEIFLQFYIVFEYSMIFWYLDALVILLIFEILGDFENSSIFWHFEILYIFWHSDISYTGNVKNYENMIFAPNDVRTSTKFKNVTKYDFFHCL